MMATSLVILRSGKCVGVNPFDPLFDVRFSEPACLKAQVDVTQSVWCRYNAGPFPSITEPLW
jgi:hypothetical protein